MRGRFTEPRKGPAHSLCTFSEPPFRNVPDALQVFAISQCTLSVPATTPAPLHFERQEKQSVPSELVAKIGWYGSYGGF